MVQSPVAYTVSDIKMAEGHIAQGERHIVQQEQLITRLRSGGFPTGEAESLLNAFQATLRQHREHHALMHHSLYPHGD